MLARLPVETPRRRDEHRIWYRYAALAILTVSAAATTAAAVAGRTCMSQHALTSPSLTLSRSTDDVSGVAECDQRRIINTPIAVTTLASESDSVEVSVFYVRVVEVLIDNVGDHTNVLCAIDLNQEKICTFPGGPGGCWPPKTTNEVSRRR